MSNKQQNPQTPEVDTEAILQQALVGDVSGASIAALAQVLIAREARLVQKEKLLEEQIKARDIERRRESDRFTIALIENQKNCKHLKGGKTRKKSQQRDPAMYMHTFTDGTTHIKCQLCKAKWMKKDTKEYLDRNGSKIPNWTKIGWEDALEMVGDSSNVPSTSERFFGTQTEQQVTEAALEAAQVPNLQL